jgi:3-oxoacid CoA-transferase B subunit
MTWRAAQEIEAGQYVNLGIGIPSMVANHIPSSANIMFHSENGMLGVGPFPLEGEEDPDIINAGKQTVTEATYCSYFSSADSFAMIRGGHIDVAILGAMQVSEQGDLANWMVPGQIVKGMGGAMDLCSGVKKVIVVMDHLDRKGCPKFVQECSLPLTGSRVVDLLITDLGIFEFNSKNERRESRLVERAPGVNPKELLAATGARFHMPESL